MKLYDSLLKNLEEILAQNTKKSLEANLSTLYPLADKNELIFKGDTAYELGGGNLPGFSGVFYTTDNNYCNDNEIILIGKDLWELRDNTPYCRIAVIKVKDDVLGTGNVMYQNLRGIDYTRYHVYPLGFMTLISSLSEHESVRISKKALKNDLSFSNVGSLYIREYLKRPSVESVKIIFITDPNVDYNEISNIITKSNNVTKALDHLMNNVKMDCHTCKLQVVCNEVEELCKEDFKKE